MTALYLATEDLLSEAVADRLVVETGPMLQVAVRLRNEGCGYLKEKLPGLIHLAPNVPVFLLTDLDRGACPHTLIASWCDPSKLPAALLFRVAVREVEAWLLADREGFSDFSGVPPNKISSTPEALEDPKRELVNLVSRYGRKTIKQDIVPAKRGTAKVGLGYNVALIAFVRESWNPARAAVRADSLARARVRLNALGANAVRGADHA